VKNKVAPPFKQAEVDIIFGEGISKEASLLDVGVAQGVVTRTGTWYSYGDVRLGQGKETARTFLKENPKVSQEIEDKVRACLAMGSAKSEGASDQAPDDEA